MQRRQDFRCRQLDLLAHDFEQLIYQRNKKRIYTSYREYLIYLLRYKCKLAGISLEKEMKIVSRINELFVQPLEEWEIESVCKPYGNRRFPKLQTIIERLEITYEEQEKMKLLVFRNEKKRRQKKKKAAGSADVKLLGMSRKQQSILQRSSSVVKLLKGGGSRV